MLFGFFQALTLPLGVYASASDFEDGRLVSPEVRGRIALTVGRGLPLVDQAAAQRLSEYVASW